MAHTQIAVWFTEEHAAAARDFWSVYSANHQTLQQVTMELAEKHPVVSAIVALMSDEVRQQQQAESLERLRRALLEGGWEEYESRLRSDAVAYAKMGLDYATWRQLVSVSMGALHPMLVRAYHGDQERLIEALGFMRAFIDRAMGTLGQTYLDAKEAEVRESEARKAAVLAAAIDAIVTMDHEGLITEFNPAAERLFGHARSDAVGQPLGELLVPERYREAHDKALARYIDHGEASILGQRREVAALRADGSEIPVEVAIVRIEGMDPPAFVGFLRDLTEQKRLEAIRAKSAELQLENRRILEASRLKSEFLANMSHELRTPLNSIIGFAELLHDGEVGPVAEQQREFLSDILTSGRHLLQLINDVLDLSKVEAGKMEFHPEPVDLERIIGEVVTVLRQVAGRARVDVTVEVNEGIRDVVIDAARLKQVLYNYLSNALKFTPAGGSVIVRARPDGDAAFRLEVEDTGPGIAPDNLGRLFIEFQQLEGGAAKRHGGTGLGLALTRRLVEAQGGAVGVRSEPGKGSVFHAILPRQPVAGIVHTRPTPRRVSAPGAPRILVVEDDPADRAQIVASLAKAGYAVETASTGAQAVAMCLDEAWDAVTLDLVLPDMSGLDVLRAIRSGEKNQHVAVVVITVIAERATAGFPVHDVLSKPLDPSRLLASLDRAGIRPDRSGRVLVVDDDPGALKLMSTTLERHGYTVDCHTAGAAALAAIEDHPPQAVILDLVMPEMDGFQFLDRFRAATTCRDIPVLVWTVADLTHEEQARLHASAQAIVQKAGGTSELLATLRHHLPAGVEPHDG